MYLEVAAKIKFKKTIQVNMYSVHKYKFLHIVVFVIQRSADSDNVSVYFLWIT